MATVKPGAIRLRGVSRSFRIAHERNATLKETLLRRRRIKATELWALRDVDLDIAPGEAIGIIGQNGSGKSTLLKLVAGILKPQKGVVEASGKIASMLELGAGFHPDFTGRENVYMNGAIHGLSEREIDRRLEEIVHFAEIEEFLDMPVKTYSSGMQMRLAFSVAIHVAADILLIDEVLAVGDESFQRKCLGRIFDFRRRGGTLVIVSHDATAIERVCSRALLIWDGKVIHDGKPSQVLATYHKQLSASTALTTESSSVFNAPEDRDQWGSGRMQIRGLELVVEGEATSTVLSGADLELRYSVFAHEAIEDPVFGVGIKTPDGIMCFGTNTHLEGQPTGRFEGERSVTVRIPALPLHEGRYVIHTSAVSSDMAEVFHWLENQCEFSVVPSRAGVGMVRLRFAWCFDN